MDGKHTRTATAKQKGKKIMTNLNLLLDWSATTNGKVVSTSGTSDINEIKVGSVYKDKQGNKYKVIKHLYGDQWQLTHTSDKKISFQTDEYSIGKTYKLVKEINNTKI